MKTRPILFTGAMVRAILDGHKTMTRRLVKAPDFTKVHGRQPCWEKAWVDPGGTIFGPGPYLKLPYGGGDYDDPDEVVTRVHCPYGYPEYGDRLWVRETHAIVPRTAYWHDPDLPHRLSPDGHSWAVYREGWDRCQPGQWKPSIHMPRWASRLTLEVTGVKGERLHDISETDAIVEGVALLSDPVNAVDEFRILWEGIHGKGSWDENPWLWCISFRKADGNAD